jgi:hypothetical protein
MSKYKYCGGITGTDSGIICTWGRIPRGFVMADDSETARRLILADKSLPYWVKVIAEAEAFIPIDPELVSDLEKARADRKRRLDGHHDATQ